MTNLMCLNESMKKSQAAVKRYRLNVKRFPGHQIWVDLLERELTWLEGLKVKRKQERNRVNELSTI